MRRPGRAVAAPSFPQCHQGDALMSQSVSMVGDSSCNHHRVPASTLTLQFPHLTTYTYVLECEEEPPSICSGACVRRLDCWCRGRLATPEESLRTMGREEPHRPRGKGLVREGLQSGCLVASCRACGGSGECGCHPYGRQGARCCGFARGRPMVEPSRFAPAGKYRHHSGLGSGCNEDRRYAHG